MINNNKNKIELPEETFVKAIAYLKKDLKRSFYLEKKPKKKKPGQKKTGLNKHFVGWLIVAIFVVAFLGGSFWGSPLFQEAKDFIKQSLLPPDEKPPVVITPIEEQKEYKAQTSQEEAIIEAVKKVSPSVVSIIITKDLPVYEQYYESHDPFEGFFGPDSPIEIEVPKLRQKGTEKQQVGGGTGFIISKDGMILTNKHVVHDEEAGYTIITNDSKRYPAKVLALDPFQDLAFLKIEADKVIGGDGELFEESFSVVKLGYETKPQIGQTVIAIGNALGEFRNTVSVGVISGLARSITASGGGIVEALEDVIQTDAAINKGNSGGPLLNLKGEVIGVNVAMAQEAQSIGFAIPIDKAKRGIEQIKISGKIIYPFLGVRYIMVTPEVQQEADITIDYGALIVKGDNGNEPAVVSGTAADEAGLQEWDVILEVDGVRVDKDNSLAKLIRSRLPGDKIIMKVLRGKEELILEAILGEKTS